MKLDELSRELADLVAAAAPSVVGVGRSGSGVIVGDGLVVTNAHNLREQVEVFFADGSSTTASVAGADVDGDLAVLSLETGGRKALEWREPEVEARLGEIVIGLSLPGGRTLGTGAGFISALEVTFRGPGGSTITGAIEHSAPLARGSSGGPLVDAQGKLLGINTNREDDGFYLALPASAQLKQRVDALARGEAPRRPRLGVALTPPRAARRLRQAVGLAPREGLLVHAVAPDGPAARSGIRPGDLIVSVDSAAVATVEELARALEEAGDSGRADVVVVRGVEEISIAVDFGSTGPSGKGRCDDGRDRPQHG